MRELYPTHVNIHFLGIINCPVFIYLKQYFGICGLPPSSDKKHIHSGLTDKASPHLWRKEQSFGDWTLPLTQIKKAYSVVPN